MDRVDRGRRSGRRRRQLAIGSMSDEFSGQITTAGCGARPAAHVLGQLHGLGDVVVEDGAPLGVELQTEPRHVALDGGDGRSSGRHRRPRPDCRTCGPASATASRTHGDADARAAPPRAAARVWPVVIRRHHFTTSMTIAAKLNPTSATAKDTRGTPPKCAITSSGLSVLTESDYAPGKSAERDGGLQPLGEHPQRGEPERPAGQPPHDHRSRPKTAGNSASSADRPARESARRVR